MKISQSLLLDRQRSKEEFARAERSIPGGLVSRIRWRENQVVFERAQGPYLWDVDGNRYIDCVMAHGPVLLGHAHAGVNAAVKENLDGATQFGGAYVRETELAEAALRQLPFASKITFMTTGTEAVQLAIRAARAVTGRDLIVKFDGHYHGWIDPVYVNIPGYDASAAADSSSDAWQIPIVPASAGQGPVGGVSVARWADLDSFAALMSAQGSQVAAVIMEPFVTGFGTFSPGVEYMQGLKEICHSHGALVIYDEIVTGFRVGPAGASGVLSVTPDMATYAKAVANGFPISMLAGTDAAMAAITDGRVPAAGTYSGTPASLSAGLATLAAIETEGDAFYEHLDTIGRRLKDGFERVGAEHGLPIVVNQIGSLAQLLFGEIDRPQTVSGVYSSQRTVVTQICEAMIARGVYTTRKGLFFLSRAHTVEDMDVVIDVFDQALSTLPSAV